MRAFFKMLAGASFALLVILLGATAFLPTADDAPLRISEADRVQSVSVGESTVFFHFEQPADVFELHVMIVAKDDHTDIMQTRIKMEDGQRFSMLLHDEDHEEGDVAHRMIFDRVDNSLLAMAIEAQPNTVMASAASLFD